MTRRTYNQFCGLAVALDLLAERWTLLVVRELLPGGRRFSDLFDSMPGVSTNLLTARLRTLEEAGVVQRRELTHPTPARVYELTDRGEELRPMVEMLGLWGMHLLPDPTTTDYLIEPRWLLAGVAMSYSGGLPDGEMAFVVDGTELTISIAGDEARLAYGPPVAAPMFTARLDGEAFGLLAMSLGHDTTEVELTGDAELMTTLFQNLPVDDAVTAPGARSAVIDS